MSAAVQMERYLRELESGTGGTLADLDPQIRLAAAGAVATYSRGEYSGYYPLSGDDMMFGVTSIDVRDFANLVLECMPNELRATD